MNRLPARYGHTMVIDDKHIYMYGGKSCKMFDNKLYIFEQSALLNSDILEFQKKCKKLTVHLDLGRFKPILVVFK